MPIAKNLPTGQWNILGSYWKQYPKKDDALLPSDFVFSKEIQQKYAPRVAEELSKAAAGASTAPRVAEAAEVKQQAPPPKTASAEEIGERRPRTWRQNIYCCKDSFNEHIEFIGCNEVQQVTRW